MSVFKSKTILPVPWRGGLRFEQSKGGGGVKAVRSKARGLDYNGVLSRLAGGDKRLLSCELLAMPASI
jgi:hypothetical protein